MKTLLLSATAAMALGFAVPAHAVLVSFTFGDVGASLNGTNPTTSTLVQVSGGGPATPATFPGAADPTHQLFTNSTDTTGLTHGNGLLLNPVTTSISQFPLVPGAVAWNNSWSNAAGTIQWLADFSKFELTSVPTATGLTGTYFGELFENTGSGFFDTGQADTLSMSVVDNSGAVSVEFSEFSTVPEPSGMAVLGVGLVGLGLAVRRRRARPAT